jgi:hypothetical protein
MLSSCSNLSDFISGNPPFYTARWGTPIDIQGAYALTGGHVDVTDVVFSEYELQLHDGDEGFIMRWGPPDSEPDSVALNVVAWSEKNETGRWDILFRVIWWNENHELDLGDIQHVTDNVDVNCTYPTVSACYYREYAMSPGPEPEEFLVVDLAYEKDREYGDGQYIRYEKWVCDDVENYNFDSFELSADCDIENIPYHHCSHPDIVHYSYPGDIVEDDYGEDYYINDDKEDVFIVYESETEDYRSIMGWHYSGWRMPIVSYSVDVPPGGTHYRPEFPRIDAGLDYEYSTVNPYWEPGDTLYYPTCMATAAWHNHKWDLSGYYDYDWDYATMNIAKNLIFISIPTPDPPNDDERWDAYPYIDYDPIYSVGYGLEYYAHFAFTQATDPPDNTDFRTMYTDTKRLLYAPDLFKYVDLYNPFTGLAGMVTIAMYAVQVPYEGTGDENPDFDVYFISNGVDGTFRYYSKKFYFTYLNEEYGYYDFAEYDQVPVAIGNLGLPTVPHPKPPIGAIFDWKSEFVGYKYWDGPPDMLHRIYGRYEIH